MPFAALWVGAVAVAPPESCLWMKSTSLSTFWRRDSAVMEVRRSDLKSARTVRSSVMVDDLGLVVRQMFGKLEDFGGVG